jgi:uncharacterized membrane-anchored protein YjiN (DUF445 family)
MAPKKGKAKIMVFSLLLFGLDFEEIPSRTNVQCKVLKIIFNKLKELDGKDIQTFLKRLFLSQIRNVTQKTFNRQMEPGMYRPSRRLDFHI